MPNKKPKFSFRHQYDEATDAEIGEQTKIVNDEPSLTNQQYTDDVNLNTIVRRFGISDGAIPPAAHDPRFYGDFSDVPDFREQWDRVRTAEQAFRDLPAELRARFNNDPAQMLDFVYDERNEDEAVKLGLLHRDHTRPPKAPDEPNPPTPPLAA